MKKSYIAESFNFLMGHAEWLKNAVIQEQEKNKNSLRFFFISFLFLFPMAGFTQTTLFTESVPNPSSTTAIGSYTGFQQYGCPYTYSGTGDVRSTNSSTGYTGASGGGNIFLSSTAAAPNQTFILSGVNTTAFTSLSLSFGIGKATNAENGSTLKIEVSTNGTTWSTLTMAALPTGTGTSYSTTYYLRTISTGIPATANLSIRFTNLNPSGTSVFFRIDDIKITGTPTAPIAPTDPTAYDLSVSNYSFTTWASTNAAGTFPTSMIFHYADANIVDPPLANVNATEDYNLGYNITCRSRINGLGTNGFSFINTNPGYATTSKGNLGEAVLAVNTACRTNILVSWTAGTITNTSNVYALRAQYRIGTSGGYTDLPNTGLAQIEYSSSINAATNFGPITLPVSCENQSVVELRWVYYYVSGSGSRSEINLTNIAVSSIANVPTGVTASATPNPINAGDTLLFSGTATNVSSWSWTGPNGFTSTSQNPSLPIITIAGAGVYTLVATNACGSATAVNTASVVVITPLPIELLDFTAIDGHQNTIVLNWSTASELNNNYFTIERSADGIEFQEIKNIPGAGNSTQLLRYSTTDGAPLKGTSYYRLKQTDFDGKQTHSAVVSVTINNEFEVRNVYPNPVADKLTIEFNKEVDETLTIKMLNNMGQVVFIENKISENSSSIDLAGFSKGMYLLIVSGNNYLYHTKVIKE